MKARADAAAKQDVLFGDAQEPAGFRVDLHKTSAIVACPETVEFSNLVERLRIRLCNE